jgi:hypothetical protein
VADAAEYLASDLVSGDRVPGHKEPRGLWNPRLPDPTAGPLSRPDRKIETNLDAQQAPAQRQPRPCHMNNQGYSRNRSDSDAYRVVSFVRLASCCRFG